MIPLGDTNKNQSIPIVTYLLILLNIVVFLLELAGGENFVMKWAFIPKNFSQDPIANIPTVFTSMFMHAGWGHLIGNMLYLWIFGDNVEERFGKFKFLIFYFICGCIATFAQFIFTSQSSVPNVGASGAIAGILGAYILMFPSEKINVLFGSYMTQLPALIVIGFWFVLQFLSSMSSSASTTGGDEAGGIAYMAHVGGFIGGLVLAGLFQTINRKIE